MISGFFDDSGKESDPSNEIVCIAGYIGVPSVLTSFTDLWRHFLLEHNLEWLHMKDFMSQRSREYSHLDLDWDQKKVILEDFTSAIKMSHLIGFGVAIDAHAWRNLPQAVTRKYGNAQEFCFIRLMSHIASRIKTSMPNETLSIMFDCDREFSPARFQRFIRVRDRIAEANQYFSAFTIGEPKLFLGLQAADLLAWETRRDVIRKSQGLEKRPEFQNMLAILPGFFPQYYGEYWTKEALDKEVASLPV